MYIAKHFSRNRTILLALGIALVGSLGMVIARPTFASAASQSGVSKNQVLDSTFYGAGDQVTIAGTVNGDVYAAGQSVDVTGTVNGDVLVAGQNVTISGNVTGSVRAMAQDLIISGKVSRGISIMSQAFVLTETGSIGSDATILAQSVKLNGQVLRDVTAMGSQVAVSGKISRNLTTNVEQLSLNDDSHVVGNVDYTSSQELDRSSSAQVGGSIKRSEPTNYDNKNEFNVTASSIAAVILYMILALALIMLVAGLLVPRWLQSVTDEAYSSPWKAMLLGLVAMAVVPLVTIIAIVTVIGIPLAVLTVTIWLLMVTCSHILTAYYVGRLMLRDRLSPVLEGILGGIVLIILFVIPIVNVVAWFISCFLGTGMMLLEFAKRRPYVCDKNERQIVKAKHKKL
jgi:cytoskeletal protein CcmA (bactofilin family)